jgi:hypothetical protein
MAGHLAESQIRVVGDCRMHQIKEGILYVSEMRCFDDADAGYCGLRAVAASTRVADICMLSLDDTGDHHIEVDESETLIISLFVLIPDHSRLPTFGGVEGMRTDGRPTYLKG